MNGYKVVYYFGESPAPSLLTEQRAAGPVLTQPGQLKVQRTSKAATVTNWPTEHKEIGPFSQDQDKIYQEE